MTMIAMVDAQFREVPEQAGGKYRHSHRHLLTGEEPRAARRWSPVDQMMNAFV
jgi:hypothetical protein